MCDVSLVTLHNRTDNMMEQGRTDRGGSPDSFCSDKWTPNPQRPYSDLQKQRNQAIVRQLLRDFDMEETVTRYRVQDSREFVLDESNFSVDISLSTMRIRQNLQRLMGTDVIRLNDRNYTDTLLHKLKEEYEANLDKKEKVLEDAEKQRLRKLMLDGIISVSAMENPDGKQHRSKKRKHNRKDIYNVHTNKKVGHPSIMHEDSPYYQAERSDTSSQSTEHKQMEHIENKESEENRKENLDNRKGGGEEMSTEVSPGTSPRESSAKKQVQWSKPKRQMQSGDGSAASPSRYYPKGKFSKKESPLLHELRHEETVAGLYKLAEKLVL